MCPYSIVLGLVGVQTTVQAMVEVIWGFMEASPSNITVVLPHIVKMLLSEVVLCGICMHTLHRCRHVYIVEFQVIRIVHVPIAVGFPSKLIMCSDIDVPDEVTIQDCQASSS